MTTMIQTRFETEGCRTFLPEVPEAVHNRLNDAYLQLINRNGAGNDFLGWLDLPEAAGSSEIGDVKRVAARLKELSQVVVVIGIGGSYLGARAIIEALQPHFSDLNPSPTAPTVLFAGNNISEDYLSDLQNILDKKEYSLIVISKSGTTTEPAIAFRILKQHCEKKYGKEGAKKRIVAITDRQRGALKQLATQEGYDTFVIPDNVGGRYSVLTPVGLLPIAVAGYDIDALLEGAHRMHELLLADKTLQGNPAMHYALIRNLLYCTGKRVELMLAYEPHL